MKMRGKLGHLYNNVRHTNKKDVLAPRRKVTYLRKRENVSLQLVKDLL